MKKITILLALLLCSLSLWSQSKIYSNLTIQKASPVLYLNGTSAILDFYNGDIRFTQSSNLLTLSGGDFSLGANNLLMTGSLGATASRLTKGWMTNLEITNLPTINGGTLASALSLSSYLIKTDTTLMLDPYLLESDSLSVFVTPTQLSDSIDAVVGVNIGEVRDEIADSLNVLRPLYVAVADSSLMLDPYALLSEVGTSYSLADSLKYFYTTFNVMDYGATGDGATDDLTEIQAAIDAATAAKGIVYLPEGTYVVTAPIMLKSNIIFRGAGRGITIIKAADGWVDSNPDAIFVFSEYGYNILCEDMTWDGNKAVLDGTPLGVTAMYTNYNSAFTHNDDITLRNIEVKDTYTHGLTLYTASPYNDNWLLDNVWIHRCGGAGNAAGMFLAGTNYLKITNSIIDSSYQHGIYDSFGHDLQITNSILRHNGYGVVDSLGSGLSIRSDSNVVVTGNIIEHGEAEGISLVNTSDTTQNVLIANNIVRYNFGTGVAIAFTRNAKIIGNLIRSSASTSTDSRYGVTFTTGCRNITVENNEIIAPNGLYFVNAAFQNIIIQNNRIGSLADNNARTRLGYGIRCYTDAAGGYNFYVKEHDCVYTAAFALFVFPIRSTVS